MSIEVEVPERVQRKARAVGPAGERWLRDLPRIVAELEAEWQIEVGATIAGGSGALVAHAISADGAAVVVKLAIPDGLDGHTPFAVELQSLVLGAGPAFVRVLRADDERRAMLQERLGSPLGALDLPVEAQIDVIAATLRAVWQRVPEPWPLRTGAEQAQSLSTSIMAAWARLGRPCPQTTVEQAVAYAQARRDAFDPATAVFVHGDAHPANVLQAADGRAGAGPFKLVDPDAMISEPAHDLAIPLRDWSAELLAAPDPAALGLEWSARLGAGAGVEPRAIWEWAFVERVSTGLFLLRLGEAAGAQLLEVADRWTGVAP